MTSYYIRQKVFSWADRFCICDVDGETRYTAQGELFSWGKKLHLLDTSGYELLFLQQKLWSWLPRFDLFRGEMCVAGIVKEFSLFHPHYRVDGPDWTVEGSFWQHDYQILQEGLPVATIHREWLSWGDCYAIDIEDGIDEELALGVVLAIDCVLAAQESASC